MTDTVVSIRMPSSLVSELRKLAIQNHYKDISEEIRSIVRQKCLAFSDPYSHQIKQIKEDISHQLGSKTHQIEKQRLVDDLTRILEQLRNEN